MAKVYTKEELFREIWDMESIGDIATVTVHNKKIREKIEYNDIPKRFQGTAIVLITAALMSIAFMGFSGMI